MRKLPLPASVVTAMLALCLLAGAAEAQLIQTFVSGGGDDTNPCSRTSPCATWSGALAKTAVGGEIDALDAGNFGGNLGTLTISHAITIDGGGGQAAGFLGIAGATFLINAGPTDVVTLRNLRFNGLAQTAVPGINGIEIVKAGVVHIENCNIYGFPKNGIAAATNTATKLIINDTTISDNLNGIQLGPTASEIRATFERVRVHNNSNAGIFLNPNGAGALLGLGLSRSTVTLNGIGLLVEPNSFADLDDTQFYGNNSGFTIVGSGIVNSFGNNAISGIVNGSLTTVPLK